MDKYALVVMSETGESYPGGQGRMLHALMAANDFKAAGVDVTLVFHGIGVTWLTAFDERADKFTQAYGSLFDEVRDTIGGACHFCAVTRFGAGESAERLGVPLLGDSGDHHTVAALVGEGYTAICCRPAIGQLDRASPGRAAARGPVDWMPRRSRANGAGARFWQDRHPGTLVAGSRRDPARFDPKHGRNGPLV